jgi:hypothetical protein
VATKFKFLLHQTVSSNLKMGKDSVLETLENFPTMRRLSALEDYIEQYDNSSEHVI